MPTFSIASLNTHYGFRPDRPSVRPYDVTAALRTLDADVMVLQEVWRPDGIEGAVDEAAAALGIPMHYTPFGKATARARWPHSAPAGEGTIGLAVMSHLPARHIGRIELGPTPGDPVPARSALEIEVDVAGTAVRIIGVHLTSRLPHGPVLQLRRLARALPPPGTPTVIAGDCNFWGPGVRRVLGPWRRAVRGRTWPARHPHSQIDHVLVRPDEISVLSGTVLGDVGSDHRPVRAELEV